MPTKILTWNINKPSTETTEFILDKIIELNPDVAILTEIPKEPKNVKLIKSRLFKKDFSCFISDEYEKYVLVCSKPYIKTSKLIEIPKELLGNVAIVELENLLVIGLFVNCFNQNEENNKKLGEILIKFLNNAKNLYPQVEMIAVGDFDCGIKGSNKNGYKKLKDLENNGWANTSFKEDQVEWISDKELRDGSFRRKNGTGKSIPDHLLATEKTAKKITKPKFLFEYLDIRLPNGVCLSDHAPLIAELHL